jgi:hypothetical protein
MNNDHLTDERIQEILDAQAPGDAPFLPWHAKTCRRCRERFQEFQRLYAGLAADPGFALPPGFADSVLARIPASRISPFRDPVICIGATGTMALLVLALFVDWKPLAAGSTWIWASLGQAFGPLAEKFHGLFSGLGAAAKPFLSGIFGLLGASLVERLLRRRPLPHGR